MNCDAIQLSDQVFHSLNFFFAFWNLKQKSEIEENYFNGPYWARSVLIKEGAMIRYLNMSLCLSKGL